MNYIKYFYLLVISLGITSQINCMFGGPNNPQQFDEIPVYTDERAEDNNQNDHTETSFDDYDHDAANADPHLTALFIAALDQAYPWNNQEERHKAS